MAKAALTVMYTVDSTIDVGMRDARLRAARYLTPDYTTKIKTEPMQFIPEQWRQHRAYLVVRLEPLAREAGAPSDGPTVAYRQWEMTTIPTGRDRWRGTPSKWMVYMGLVRSSERDPWRISEVLTQNKS
ncbi:hypothetical protein [Actinomadura rugatobispora]|uniref:Uncharacterized protein n=1 Tax=Actinomadura rugatobispora TaxID=1994 RepID=A0ABW1A9T7_9ACTN